MFTNIQTILLSKFDEFRERPAIIGHGRKYLYSELKHSALKIAGYLFDKNIHNSCVYVQSDDSFDHITAILGVILSGNYYASITTENINMFLMGSPFLPACILFNSIEVELNFFHTNYVQIKDVIESTHNIDPIDLPVSNDHDNFCVFMTSGSTSMPKFVAHTIKNIIQDTFRQISSNTITCDDVFDQVFSFSFSASLATIFPAFFTGAAIAPYNLKRESLIHLKSFWKNNSVSFSTLSVSTFRTLCQLNDNFADCKFLRLVSIGAEPVFPRDVSLFFSKFSSDVFLQVTYAATETRTISEYKISKNEDQSIVSSVGKPVRGKKVIILSDDGTELPVGSTGEIVIESEFIAVEYLNNRKASKASFSNNNGVIRYKTGDIGNLNAKGLLYFSGRKEHEIKIFGQKIDFFLIEKIVKMSDGIKEVAAVIDNSNLDAPTISVFICHKNQYDLNEIQNNLKTHLPPHHVPNSYIKIDKFPRTHTGKIDRKKLESLAIKSNNESNYPNSKIGTLDNLRKTIISIWKDFFNDVNINADTNFFTHLGGDSLTAVNLMREMEKKLRVSLPINVIILYRTPTNIAQVIENDLYQSPISLIRINGFDKHKTTICFIEDSGHTRGKFTHFINSILGKKFNLALLCSDFFTSHKDIDACCLIKKMKELLNEEKDIILMGFSLNGYIAYQLSTIVPKTSLVVLLDTPNYFEYERYKYSERDRINFLRREKIKLLIKEKDYYGLFKKGLNYFRHHLKKRIAGSNLGKSLFVIKANRIISQIFEKNSNSSCLFVKANRSNWSHNFDHGSNWEKHFNGDFQLLNFLCKHEEVYDEKHSLEIIKQILNFTEYQDQLLR